MLNNLNKCNQKNPIFGNFLRFLTTTEVSTALRPFYFNVHPDLFGKYPTQRATNENSLKQLSALIETLQDKRIIKPTNLQFYLRDKHKKEDFKLIKIYINGRDIREAVLRILKACDLSTEFVDKIPKPEPQPVKHYQEVDFSNVSENDPIFGPIIMQQKIQKAKDALRLKTWLEHNHQAAKTISEGSRPLRDEIDRLKTELINRLSLLDCRWECGWNITHFRGCLQSFMALAEQHGEVMHVLRGRMLVFAPFTGISLDGHIMLNSGEVRHNWLDLIKNVKRYDQILLRIPGFERSVSQVLREIKIGRRKFMPKILAGEYERNLQQVTTSLSDYRGRRGFPNAWPSSLNSFELVVETEAGPLMVSPTGQFIVPSSLPGDLLVNFITTHLEEAHSKSNNYENNKYKERALHKQVAVELGLADFKKDDNVTPDLMIKCCEKLLISKNVIGQFTKDLHLNITTYYSLLSDGTVCIPWNWEL